MADCWDHDGDRALIDRLAAGDTTVYHLLYDRYHPLGMGLIRRHPALRDDAEDIFQDAFLNIWRSAATYRADRGQVRPWIVRVIRARMVDWYRRRRRDVACDPIEAADGIADGFDVAAEVSRRVEGQRVNRAVVALPSEQRIVLRLIYSAGLSSLEVSDLLGIPRGTVKSRIRLALQALRRTLIEPSVPVVGVR